MQGGARIKLKLLSGTWSLVKTEVLDLKFSVALFWVNPGWSRRSRNHPVTVP